MTLTPSAALITMTGQSMLRIEAWLDPVVDEVGHDPRSAYVETYWLPILGPSTTWLLRRLAAHLEEGPGGVVLDQEELARALGLGERFGPNAPFARTVKRCVDFEMAQWREESLAVRRYLPPLARRHLRRLPDTLQVRHAAEVEATRPLTLTDRLRLHGRRLALSLLDYGEDRAAVEHQLILWAFHPALASECAAWAALEHSRRQTARAAHPATAAQAEPKVEARAPD
ncbi:MAG: hypothetical protein ABSH30_00550 [Acidimicrobiales bacterium]|jgi:hypothetical protein